MLNYLINLLFSIFPPTHFFKFKVFCLQFANAKIGKSTSICSNIKIYGRGKLIIGDFCWIGIGCQFHISSSASIKIDHNCDIAPNVQFITGTHEIGTNKRRAGRGVANDILIGSGSWIGAGSILLAGVSIGEGTVVAAGSVVKAGTYPSNVLLAGIPAKIIKSYS